MLRIAVPHRLKSLVGTMKCPVSGENGGARMDEATACNASVQALGEAAATATLSVP